MESHSTTCSLGLSYLKAYHDVNYLFSLIYGTEAVVPTEVMVLSAWQVDRPI